MRPPHAKSFTLLHASVGCAKFPRARFSSESEELIKETCHKDPSRRLPVLAGGVVENLYPHLFFEESKWALLEERKVKDFQSL